MNQPTKYTELILNFLESEENYTAMIEWVEELPDLEQSAVFREIAAILRDRHEKTGDKDCLKLAHLIENGIDQFEEDILDEKLDKALFMMQFDNVEINEEQVLPFLIEARKLLIKCFLSNPEDSKELRKIALKAIKVERNCGIYDPANWKKIFP